MSRQNLPDAWWMMVKVEGGARDAVRALAATLAALGGAAIVTFAVADRRFAGWEWGLAWVGFLVGFGLLLVQAIPPLERAASRPWRIYKQGQTDRLARDARYRQSLRCSSCGHEFEEIVRNTRGGWLEYDGAVRACPSCGNTRDGFTGLKAVPLNKAAQKMRAL